MNPKLKTLIIVGLFILCPIAKAGLILTQGQSYEFEFSSISLYAFDPDDLFGDPPLNTNNALPGASFDLGVDQLDPGESLIFSSYENDTLETPTGSAVYTADRHSFSGFGMNVGETVWQDLQGVLRIEVISGTVELDTLTASTVIDGKYYKQAFAIPEPNSVALVFIGSGILYLRRKRFSNQRLEPTRANVD